MDLTGLFAILLLGVVLSVTFHWVSYHRGGAIAGVGAERYRHFHDAFIAADAWLAVAAAIGAVGLIAGQRYGPVFALLAGSALIFLAPLDIVFEPAPTEPTTIPSEQRTADPSAPRPGPGPDMPQVKKRQRGPCGPIGDTHAARP